MTSPSTTHDARCPTWQSDDPTGCDCRDQQGHTPHLEPIPGHCVHAITGGCSYCRWLANPAADDGPDLYEVG